jgi:glycosyltransferase involved in cell wall biosynthesis
MAQPRKRLLFISHNAERTGAPIGLLAFMRWMKSHDKYDLGTILMGDGPLLTDFQALGPTTLATPGTRINSGFGRLISGLLHWTKNEDATISRFFSSTGPYDLIFSNTLTNAKALDALAPFQAPVVTHVHELEYWISKCGNANFESHLTHSNHYIAVSEAVRDNLVRNHAINASRVTLVYEHIRGLPSLTTAEERQSARTRLNIPLGAIVIGGCGAEHWRKGRDMIPMLLIALRRRQPQRDFHFLWIGRAANTEDEFNLKFDLRNAGLDSNFHATGEVEDPFKIFPAIDTFALLSRDDPYPLACLEIAATGVPVVCFAGAGGTPEFVSDECGFVAPYLDIDAMASDICRLASNPDLSRAFGHRAREKVSQQNLLEHSAPALLSIIEKLLNEPTQSRSRYS